MRPLDVLCQKLRVISISYFLSRVLKCCIFFFFSSRRRHTRLQGDWSSDVCSSDLAGPRGPGRSGLVPAIFYTKVYPASTNEQASLPNKGWPQALSPLIIPGRSEEHTSELQSPCNLVCRLLLEKKKKHKRHTLTNYN